MVEDPLNLGLTQRETPEERRLRKRVFMKDDIHWCAAGCCAWSAAAVPQRMCIGLVHQAPTPHGSWLQQGLLSILLRCDLRTRCCAHDQCLTPSNESSMQGHRAGRLHLLPGRRLHRHPAHLPRRQVVRLLAALSDVALLPLPKLPGVQTVSCAVGSQDSKVLSCGPALQCATCKLCLTQGLIWCCCVCRYYLFVAYLFVPFFSLANAYAAGLTDQDNYRCGRPAAGTCSWPCLQPYLT